MYQAQRSLEPQLVQENFHIRLAGHYSWPSYDIKSPSDLPGLLVLRRPPLLKRDECDGTLRGSHEGDKSLNRVIVLLLQASWALSSVAEPGAGFVACPPDYLWS